MQLINNERLEEKSGQKMSYGKGKLNVSGEMYVIFEMLLFRS